MIWYVGWDMLRSESTSTAAYRTIASQLHHAIYARVALRKHKPTLIQLYIYICIMLSWCGVSECVFMFVWHYTPYGQIEWI